MKEYLRINTFRRKPSEFYHVKNKKKKVGFSRPLVCSRHQTIGGLTDYTSFDHHQAL